jgi:hypothetical protein
MKEDNMPPKSPEFRLIVSSPSDEVKESKQPLGPADNFAKRLLSPGDVTNADIHPRQEASSSLFNEVIWEPTNKSDVLAPVERPVSPHSPDDQFKSTHKLQKPLKFQRPQRVLDNRKGRYQSPDKLMRSLEKSIAKGDTLSKRLTKTIDFMQTESNKANERGDTDQVAMYKDNLKKLQEQLSAAQIAREMSKQQLRELSDLEHN